MAIRPLVKYLAANFAVDRQQTMGTKSTPLSPLLSLKSWSQAMLKEVTAIPFAVLRSSGSAQSRPPMSMWFSIRASSSQHHDSAPCLDIIRQGRLQVRLDGLPRGELPHAAVGLHEGDAALVDADQEQAVGLLQLLERAVGAEMHQRADRRVLLEGHALLRHDGRRNADVVVGDLCAGRDLAQELERIRAVLTVLEACLERDRGAFELELGLWVPARDVRCAGSVEHRRGLPAFLGRWKECLGSQVVRNVEIHAAIARQGLLPDHGGEGVKALEAHGLRQIELRSDLHILPVSACKEQRTAILDLLGADHGFDFLNCSFQHFLFSFQHQAFFTSLRTAAGSCSLPNRSVCPGIFGTISTAVASPCSSPVI
nr:MAG TPA: hypothetical protein [Caudoviricetes sp.]